MTAQSELGWGWYYVQSQSPFYVRSNAKVAKVSDDQEHTLQTRKHLISIFVVFFSLLKKIKSLRALRLLLKWLSE